MHGQRDLPVVASDFRESPCERARKGHEPRITSAPRLPSCPCTCPVPSSLAAVLVAVTGPRVVLAPSQVLREWWARSGAPKRRSPCHTRCRDHDKRGHWPATSSWSAGMTTRLPKRSKVWMTNAPDWVKNAYRLRLEIEYRRSHGTSFQQLFNRIMRSMHGDDFCETVAMGREGDLGCDGYLTSQKRAFAVYAPEPYFRLNDARRKCVTILHDFASAGRFRKRREVGVLL